MFTERQLFRILRILGASPFIALAIEVGLQWRTPIAGLYVLGWYALTIGGLLVVGLLALLLRIVWRRTSGPYR